MENPGAAPQGLSGGVGVGDGETRLADDDIGGVHRRPDVGGRIDPPHTVRRHVHDGELGPRAGKSLGHRPGDRLGPIRVGKEKRPLPRLYGEHLLNDAPRGGHHVEFDHWQAS